MPRFLLVWTTANPVQRRDAFLEGRAGYVEPAIADFIASGIDIEALTRALRALSGIYGQAAFRKRNLIRAAWKLPGGLLEVELDVL